ncbi:MAG: helix-turn-helix transcriptional regulator [Bryobacterales bacterium]|nr:helix-turn-helix transcriptional regulator [Bryobacterales bacterium]
MYPNLKLQLWRAGIRQNRLAQLLGMDETMLSKVINGYRSASPELRGKIAVILQQDEEWLFESIVTPKPDLNGPTRA